MIDLMNQSFEAPTEEAETLVSVFAPAEDEGSGVYYMQFSEILRVLKQYANNPQLKAYNLQTAMRRYQFTRKVVRKARFQFPTYVYLVRLKATDDWLAAAMEKYL